MKKVQTLSSPVYEVKKDSEWYKLKKQEQRDIKKFFKTIAIEYNLYDGFAFYHSGYFGIEGGTREYEQYKGELRKNPDKNGFYPFRKNSEYFKAISKLIEKIRKVDPFKSHDIFGRNNVRANQWVKDRWFFEVKNQELIRSEEVTSIGFKDYLKVVIDTLD